MPCRYRPQCSQQVSETRANHDTIYSVLLAVVTFFQLMSTTMMGFMTMRPGLPAESAWVLRLVFVVELFPLLLEVVVLIIRIAFPAYRKWPTVVLNIVLLPWLPFGTALGIYGLWKVDKLRDTNQIAHV